MKNKLTNMIKHRSCHLINHRLDHANCKTKCMNHLYNNLNNHKVNVKDNFKEDSNDNFQHYLNKSKHKHHQSKLNFINNLPTMRQSSISSFHLKLLFIFCFTLFNLINAQSSVTFEKLTNRDYSGFTYYTIRNVSLYECLGKFEFDLI